MTTYFSQEEPTLMNVNVNGQVIDPHGNMIDVTEKLNSLARCSICNKQVKTKGFTHYKCRNVVSRLEKAKRNVCDLEFKLFCLMHTSNITVHTIE